MQLHTTDTVACPDGHYDVVDILCSQEYEQRDDRPLNLSRKILAETLDVMCLAPWGALSLQELCVEPEAFVYESCIDDTVSVFTSMDAGDDPTWEQA